MRRNTYENEKGKWISPKMVQKWKLNYKPSTLRDTCLCRLARD